MFFCILYGFWWSGGMFRYCTPHPSDDAKLENSRAWKKAYQGCQVRAVKIDDFLVTYCIYLNSSKWFCCDFSWPVIIFLSSSPEPFYKPCPPCPLLVRVKNRGTHILIRPENPRQPEGFLRCHGWSRVGILIDNQVICFFLKYNRLTKLQRSYLNWNSQNIIIKVISKVKHCEHSSCFLLVKHAYRATCLSIWLLLEFTGPRISWITLGQIKSVAAVCL